MRALFEDIPNNTGAVTNAAVVVHEVGFPPLLPNSRRDLWFKFTRTDGTTIAVKAFATRASTGTHVASAAITVGAAQQTVTFARNGTETPDLTGLVIVGTFSAAITGTNVYWWGYTAAPDLVVADNACTLLLARTGAGQALDGIGTNIYTGDEQEAEFMPLIAIVAQPIELDTSTNAGSTMRLNCPLEIHVALDSASSPATAWRTCRAYMAAVESILHDECRRSYGECHVLYRQSSQGPGPVPGKRGVMVGVVRLVAVFLNVFRDDVYPRS